VGFHRSQIHADRRCNAGKDREPAGGVAQFRRKATHRPHAEEQRRLAEAGLRG
jgi:hypothetical protein